MDDKDTLIIAHRGASGYLPEHTLESKAYAHAVGAHFIEQDLVATRDDHLVVLHDIYLDQVTNVVQAFPGRHRDDGRYYVRDFDLSEIKNLRVWERRKKGGTEAVFPNRFPTGVGHFRVSTLREEIKLIQGLNMASGRVAGIYPEIKRPKWHRVEGVDITVLALDLLAEFGYRTRKDAVYLQCFDLEELQRIRKELGCQLKLVQLIAENEWSESDTDYEKLKTLAGLKQIAGIVDGVGPWFGQLVDFNPNGRQPVSTGFVSAAHEVGLVVHPYTFRADQLPPGFDSLQEMVCWFVNQLEIDGLFTDFPDIALRALQD